MDEIKDIVRDKRSLDQLSRFIDAKRLETEPFGENKMGERAYRRAERIVLALTLLTNHMPAAEPVRKQIREKSISLLAAILDARSEMRSFTSVKIQEIKASVRELVSLLRILAVSGAVSLQNAEIVSEALDELGVFIGVSERSVLSDMVRVSRQDLTDTHTSAVIIKDIKDRESLKDKPAAKEAVLYKAPRHESRSAGILEHLRSTEALGIREIAQNFPEYSEKMVQRELADLVSRGVVRKIGFKRWSKYVVISEQTLQ